MGTKLQDAFDYSKNSESRKPDSWPSLLSSFAAKMMTPYLVSYSSITISTPELPIQSICAPVLPYSGKDTSRQTYFIPTRQRRWKRQSVPKHWHIKFRCRGITQKKAYSIQNTAKVWNQ